MFAVIDIEFILGPNIHIQTSRSLIARGARPEIESVARSNFSDSPGRTGRTSASRTVHSGLSQTRCALPS